MKRIVSIILSMLMLLSCTSFVFAADKEVVLDGADAAIVVSDAEVSDGVATVTVEMIVSSSYTGDVAGGEFVLNYPSASLSTDDTKVSKGAVTYTQYNAAEAGKIKVQFAGSEDVIVSGSRKTLCTVEFSVVEGATGIAELTLTDTTSSNSDLDDLTLQLVNGTITLPAAKHTATFTVDGETYGTPVEYAEGEVIEAPETDPVKDGYTFMGWEGFTAGSTVMGNADVAFAAIFEEIVEEDDGLAEKYPGYTIVYVDPTTEVEAASQAENAGSAIDNPYKGLVAAAAAFAASDDAKVVFALTANISANATLANGACEMVFTSADDENLVTLGKTLTFANGKAANVVFDKVNISSLAVNAAGASIEVTEACGTISDAKIYQRVSSGSAATADPGTTPVVTLKKGIYTYLYANDVWGAQTKFGVIYNLGGGSSTVRCSDYMILGARGNAGSETEIARVVYGDVEANLYKNATVDNFYVTEGGVISGNAYVNVDGAEKVKNLYLLHGFYQRDSEAASVGKVYGNTVLKYASGTIENLLVYDLDSTTEGIQNKGTAASTDEIILIANKDNAAVSGKLEEFKAIKYTDTDDSEEKSLFTRVITYNGDNGDVEVEYVSSGTKRTDGPTNKDGTLNTDYTHDRTIGKIKLTTEEEKITLTDATGTHDVSGETELNLADYTGDIAIVFGATAPEVATYTVTYATEEGTAPEAATVEAGQSVILPAAPAVKAGYTFAWVIGGTSYGAGASYTPAASVTATADWTANTDTAYTVEIYLAGDGGAYPATASETKSLAGTTDTTATAAHADYTYDGYEADTEAENVISGTITGDGGLVLKLYYKKTAEPEPATYTATFTVDGAVYGDVAYYAENAEITKPAAPVKDGYTFLYWSLDGQTEAASFIMGTENVTYIAVFEEITEGNDPPADTYATVKTEVTYNKTSKLYTAKVYFSGQQAATAAFGYTYGEYLEYVGFNYGEEMIASEYIPDSFVPVDTENRRLVNVAASASGLIDGTTDDVLLGTYTFRYTGSEDFDKANASHNIAAAEPTEVIEGISDASGFLWTESIYDPEVEFYHVIFDGVTVTVTEEAPVTYTITFKAYGDIVSTADYAEGGVIIVPDNPAPAEGYKFAGWAIEGTETVITIPETATANATYVAVFEAEAPAPVTYTITFKAYGSIVSTADYAEGGVIIVPDNPAPAEGYKFAGWAIEGTETVITIPETATAQYEAGAAITVPADPAKDGYDFIGWKIEGTDDTAIVTDFTMSTSDVTYVAVFEEKADPTLVLTDLYINANASTYAKYGLTSATLNGRALTIVLPYGWPTNVIPQAGDYNKDTNPAMIKPITASGITATYTAPEGTDVTTATGGKIEITNGTSTKTVPVSFVLDPTKPEDKTVPETGTNSITGLYTVSSGTIRNKDETTKTREKWLGFVNAASEKQVGADNVCTSWHTLENVAKLIPVYAGGTYDKALSTVTESGWETTYYGKNTSSTNIEGYGYFTNNYETANYPQYRFLVYYEDTAGDGFDTEFVPAIYLRTTNGHAPVTVESATGKYKTGRWEYVYFNAPEDMFGLCTQPTFYLFGKDKLGNNFKNDVLYVKEIVALAEPDAEYKQYMPVEYVAAAGKITNVDSDVEFTTDGGASWTLVTNASNYNATEKALYFNSGATVKLRYAARAATQTVGAYASSDATDDITVEAAVTAQYVAKFECDYIDHDDVTAESGATITLPTPSQGDYPDGCTFLGWKANGEGEILAAGTEVQLLGDITYEAEWEQNKFLITYETNFGTPPAAAWTEDGGMLTLADEIRKNDSTFKWVVKDSDPAVAYEAGSVQTFTANTTLVATWTLDTTLVISNLYINYGAAHARNPYTRYGVNAAMLAIDSGEITITLPYGWDEAVVPQAGPYNNKTNPAVIIPVAETGITAEYTAPSALSAAGKITISNAANNTTRDVAVKFTISTVVPENKIYTNYTGMYAYSNAPGIANLHYTTYQEQLANLGVEVGASDYHGKTDVAKFVPVYAGGVLDGNTISPGGTTKFTSGNKTFLQGAGVFDVIDAESIAQYRFLVYYETGENGKIDVEAGITPAITLAGGASGGNADKATLISDNYKTGRWEYLYFAAPEDAFGWIRQSRIELLGDTTGSSFADDVLYVAEYAALATPDEKFLQYKPVDLDSSVAGRISNVDADVEFRLLGETEYTAVTDYALYDAAEKTLLGLAGGTYELRYTEKAATDTVGAYAASEAAVVAVTAPTEYAIRYESEIGTAPEAVTYEIGSGEFTPEVMTDEGNVFDGWKIKGTDTVLEAGESFIPTGDTILVAIWKKNVTGSVKVARIGVAARNFAQISIYDAENTFIEAIEIENDQTVTNEDGVFEFTVKLVEGTYTAVIEKAGYLDYEIEFTVGETGAQIAQADLVAGDVAKPENSVDLADFAEIVRVFDGDAPTEEELAKYDIDEDGEITVSDLDWIKANFGAVIAE